MSTAVSARVAGFVFLIYIAAGLASLSLTQAGADSAGAAEKLAGMAENVTRFRYAALLDLACAFSALILAVTLFAVTAAHGATTALLAMVCRLVEGVLIATSLLDSLGVLWLAAGSDVASEEVQMLASHLMRSEVALTSIFLRPAACCSPAFSFAGGLFQRRLPGWEFSPRSSSSSCCRPSWSGF